MDSPMKQAAKFLRDKQGGRRRLAVFLCLALLVTAGTVTAFALHGQTSQHTQRVLQCAYAVHQHSEDCYPGGDTNAAPVCGLADFVVHTHNEDCYPGGDMTAAPVCGLAEIEAHTHGDDCYAAPLVCGLEETGPHTHTAACYSEEDRTVADGHPEIEAVEGHIHGEACYAPAELICGQEERPAVAAVEADPGHTHTDECYTETSALTCGQDGVEGHEHTEECYTVSRELTCGQEERPAVDAVAGDEGHTHTEGCYAAPVLTCELEEIEPVEGHVHTEECYTIAEGAEPACGIEETEGHTHSEECYGEPELTCEKAEIELHTHSEEEGCYAPLTEEEKQLDPVPEHGALICDKLQIEEHTHGEECFIEEVLTPEEVADLESEAQQPGVVDLDPLTYADGQIQVTVRYDSASLLPEGVGIALIDAGTPEPALDISQQAAPAPEETEEPAGPDSAPASLPAVDASSAPEAEGEPAPLAEPVPEGEPAPAATPAEGEIDRAPAEPAEPAAPAEPIEPAEPAPADPAEPAAPVEGETGSETDAPALVRAGFVDAEGREWRPAATVIYTVEYLLDGAVAASADYEYTPGGTLPTFPCALATFEQTVETDSFKVTARYTELAGLGDAELRASSITDPEQVAEYEAAYRQAVSSEQARMLGLLDIGFWNGDAEVQPAVPVAITVQLLGEDGLPAGEPVKVVHFGDETEHFDAKVDEQGVASFNLRSFSPVAIGQVPETDEEGRVSLDHVFMWANDMYEMTFHITGVAGPKAEEPENADVPETTDNEKDPKADAPSESEATAGEGEDESDEPKDEEIGSEADKGEEINAPLAREEFLVFEAQQLSEGDPAYQEYERLAEMDAVDLLKMLVLRYSITYNGVPMDLSHCTIEVNVVPTEQMMEYAKEQSDSMLALFNIEKDEWEIAPEAVEEGAFFALDSAQAGTEQVTATVNELASIIAENRQTEEQPLGEPQTEKEIITAKNSDQSRVVISDLRDETPVSLCMRIEPYADAAPQATDDTIVVQVQGHSNPHFSVEYYAIDLPRANLNNSWSGELEHKTPKSSLPVISTDTDMGGHMPENSTNNKVIQIALKSEVDGGRRVVTTPTETQIYRTRTDLTYFKQPGLEYFNALEDNKHYELTQIWYKAKDSDQWITVNYDPATTRFSNRQEGLIDGYTYIKITDGATIRLCYSVAGTPITPKVYFYDYDISDANSGFKTALNTGNTGSQALNGSVGYGINSNQNYSGTGTRFAFGNRNCGTPYGWNLWDNNLLNAGNRALDGGAKGKNTVLLCTFGMVTGMDNNGTDLIFADGIDPIQNLFNEGKVHGKTPYQGTLTFSNVGDTYTLTTATVAGRTTGSLDRFEHPGNGAHTHIWTNNFWPLDGVQGVDPHFGSNTQENIKGWSDHWPATYQNTLNALSYGTKTPIADDYKDHNCFFGMRYSVDFELDGEYIGPLEYLFFGDDDMWVFLSQLDDAGNITNSELICDIGGVHSSVGEYINLWNHINKPGSTDKDAGATNRTFPGEGKYRLTFFYTERGASGSTCWMQFTLPSVSVDSTVNEEQFGQLVIKKEVQKEIVGSNGTIKTEHHDTGEEFIFAINLTNASGSDAGRDYSYVKTLQDGSTICDLVLHDGSHFTLKDGESIQIEYLPIGTQYKITELGRVVESTDKDGNNTVVSVTAHAGQYAYDVYMNGQLVQKDAKVEGDKEIDGQSATITGQITGSEKIKVVTVQNRYRVYQLPKTGGVPGIVYVGGGTMLVMLAAVLYTQRKRRKKAEDTPAR